MKSATPAPAMVRAGHCGAHRLAGPCPCPHVASITTVGAYATCGACGHTVAIHALEEVPA